MIIICVACKHEHHNRERLEKPGIRYTMCPKCGCGGFIKKR